MQLTTTAATTSKETINRDDDDICSDESKSKSKSAEANRSDRHVMSRYVASVAAAAESTQLGSSVIMEMVIRIIDSHSVDAAELRGSARAERSHDDDISIISDHSAAA